MNDYLSLTPEKRQQLSRKYGRFPRWVASGAVLHNLSGNETKVLVCLCDRMDNFDNNTWITRAEISRISGVCYSSISRITADLTSYQIILKKQNGGRTEYTVNLNAPEWWLNGGGLLNTRRRQAHAKRVKVAEQNFRTGDGLQETDKPPP